MRASLRRVLEAAPGIRVVADAGDLALARQHVWGHRPDVLILGLQLNDASILGEMAALRGREPRTRVIIASNENAPAFAARALSDGASGYVLEDRAADDLPRAVRDAVRGEIFVSDPIASRLTGGAASSAL